jgi:tripartite-type tricarboxylate transporter receptor subunit TctC
MFKVMADINMTHVPYRGVAPAFADLLGGQVQVLHLVGAGNQVWWQGKTDCSSGLEID